MNWKVAAGVGTILGAAAGAAAGYFYATKRLESYYSDVASMEIAEAKEYYSTFYKSGEDSTPEGALQKRHPGVALNEAVAANPVKVLTDEKVAPPSAETMERVLQGLRYGTPSPADTKIGMPEIISKEEYFENDWGYSQTSIEYYADDVLVDEDEDVMDNVNLTVGLANLKQFGKRSRDPNVLYVKNDRVKVLYEIVRNEITYAEVSGLKEE